MFAFFTLIIGLIPLTAIIIDSIDYGLIYIISTMISKKIFKYGTILNLLFLVLTLFVYLKVKKVMYRNILRIFICFFIISIFSSFLSTIESRLYSDKMYYCFQIFIKPIAVGVVLFFVDFFSPYECRDISNK